MNHRLFSAVCGLAVFISAGGGTAAVAATAVTAFYDPADGNIRMSVLTDGVPATLPISGFQFLSPSQKLSGSAAAIPPAAVSFFTVLNTDASAIYEPPRQYAEIYANGLGSTLFNSTWNLGNVAQTGLSQADLGAAFLSNGDVLAPAQPGKFLYEHNATWFAGDVVAVPEPSNAVMIGVGGFLLALATVRSRPRRRVSP